MNVYDDGNSYILLWLHTRSFDAVDILQITKKFPHPKNDGESWAVQALAEGLRQSGCTIDLFSLNTKQHFATEEVISVFQSDGPYIDIYIHDADITASRWGALTNLMSASSYHAARFNKLEEAKRELQEIISGSAYDALLVESVFMLLLLDLDEIEVPVILRAHNVESTIWSRYAERHMGAKSWYFGQQAKQLHKLESTLLQKVDLVLAMSHIDQASLKHMSDQGSIEVVTVGMDTMMGSMHERRCGDREPPFLFGYLGSLDWRPNLEGLKWFFKYVWREFTEGDPDPMMMVAGRNGQNVKWEYIPNVSFIGEVSDSNGYFRQIDALLVPLWSGSGTRIKILQAFAMGIPVIATSIAAEGLPVEDGKHLLIADDINQWKEAMINIQDKALRSTLVSAASSYLDQYHNVSVEGSRTLDFMRRACARR